MATAFNAYKPPEHGLVYFVFSNLVPTNSNDKSNEGSSKEESSRMKQTELKMATNTMEVSNKKMQEPDDRAAVFKGQGSQKFDN